MTKSSKRHLKLLLLLAGIVFYSVSTNITFAWKTSLESFRLLATGSDGVDYPLSKDHNTTLHHNNQLSTSLNQHPLVSFDRQQDQQPNKKPSRHADPADDPRDKGLAPSHAALMDCHSQLEVYKNQKIQEWLQARVPFLEAVIESDAHYTVLVLWTHLQHEKDHWKDVTWYCGVPSEENSQAVASSTATFFQPERNQTVTVASSILKRYNQVQVLTCPRHFSTNNQGQQQEHRLDRIWPSQSSNVTGVVPNYNVQPFLKCDATEIEHFRSTTQTLRSNPKQHDEVSGSTIPSVTKAIAGVPTLGACAILRSVSHLLPIWVEYHRLLGVQHFWIYVNEPMTDSNTTKLYDMEYWASRPYVTFIPYNYYWWDSHHEYAPYFRWSRTDVFWQNPMQFQCLYKAKRSGIPWLITTDVDEYIWVNETAKNAYESSETSPKTIDPHEPHLLNYLESHFPNTSLGALQMNSIPFGRNKWTESENNTFPTLLDYTFRLNETPPNRFKLLYRPPHVWSLELHAIVNQDGKRIKVSNHTTEPGEVRELTHDQVYFHHYKKPWKQVFHRFWKGFQIEAEDMYQDTMMRDSYKETLLQLVNQS